MPLHWVAYRRSNLLAGAVIIEAPSPDQARTRAALLWDDPLLEFAEAHALSDWEACLVTKRNRGRLLSLSDTYYLTMRFEQAQQRLNRDRLQRFPKE